MYRTYDQYPMRGDVYGVPGVPGGFANVTLPTVPLVDPLKAGMQFGLLGAASGLGYSALRTALGKKKPGGLGVARDMLIGTLLGATFGALAAKENKSRFPGTPVGSYSDVARAIDVRLGKQGMQKQAILPLVPLLFAGLSALSAADAVRSGGKTIGALAKGNWRQAAGHGLATLGNAAMAIPGAGSVVRVAKGMKFIRPLVKPMYKGLNAAARVNKAMYATMPRMAGTIGGMTAANIGSNRLLNPGAPPVPTPAQGAKMLPAAGSAAIGANLLRMVPPPQTPQFRTLL